MSKISVVVPIYNSEKTLVKCLNSLLCQTYKNLEIILINDGSKDSSQEICENFVNRDNRIRLINKVNEGVSAARNDGIHFSTGEFIVFVDSDDFVSPNYIYNMWRCYDIDKTLDLVISGFKVVDKSKVERRSLNDCKLTRKEFHLELLNIVKSSISSYPFNKMFKTSIIKKYNLKFDETISFAEDHMFNLLYYYYVENMRIINETDYFYIIDESGNSLSGNYKPQFFDCRQLVLTEIQSILKSNELFKIEAKEYYLYYLNYVILYSINQLFLTKKFTIKQKKIEFIRMRGNVDNILFEYLNSSGVTNGYKQKIYLNLFKRGYFYSIYSAVKIMNILKTLRK